jgi:hypothetical protein
MCIFFNHDRFYEEAAKIALEKKNEEDLRYIRLQCLGTERAVADKIAGMIEQLKSSVPDRSSRR